MQKEFRMKVVGIIAEYNPFHNGHQYQIDQIRKLTGADYIVVIMSGNFLERGVPAIIDKYTRAKMALNGGADLILELPALWATASAERFAEAGVMLLASTGVVDTICYGAEQPNAALSQQIVSLLTHHAFDNEEIFQLQKQGFTYPAARAQVLSRLLPAYDPQTILSFLSSPNNILGLEYERAIAKWNAIHTQPICGQSIQRIGGGYHDETLHPDFSSATAIRTLLLNSSPEEIPASLRLQVPPCIYETLTDALCHNELLDIDDFSDALYARLWSYRTIGYTQFADCNIELSNKIANTLDQYISFRDFAGLLKTREVTYTRVCRVLTHILLDIRKEDYTAYTPDTSYLRILGFRRLASPLLAAIKKEAALPLITKMADASSFLSAQANALLSRDIATADLYRSIHSIHRGQTLPNEFTQPIVIL